MTSIRSPSWKQTARPLLGAAAAALLVIAGMGASAAATRMRLVIAPPGACVLEDSAFQTADGGCKDAATWLVYSARHGQGHWDDAINECSALSEGGDVVYDDWSLPSKSEMLTAAADGAGAHLEWGGDDIGGFWPWSGDSAGTSAWRVNYVDGTTKKSLKSSWLLFDCRRYAGPSGLSASVISKSQINLAWTDNSDSETGFVIERSVDQSNWTSLPTQPANTAAFSDNGLSANTTYYYRVRAQGTVNDSPRSAVASAKTKR